MRLLYLGPHKYVDGDLVQHRGRTCVIRDVGDGYVFVRPLRWYARPWAWWKRNVRLGGFWRRVWAR